MSLADDDEPDWSSALDHEAGNSDLKEPKKNEPSERVIIHLDLDCFYAQVEMIRNKDLRDKPMGTLCLLSYISSLKMTLF